ncbi:MAG: hypothetical protein IJW51_07115 [Clostridia bacterium]|nr:hypothetical protein [Clostridia bacterium]
MNLKYLGTAAAEGIPGVFCECETCKKALALGGRHIRTRSQAVIDNALLIDLPADTYLHYLQHRFPLYSIKQCLITHSHADHLYPLELEMIKKGYSHLSDYSPLHIYSDVDGYNKLSEVVNYYSIGEVRLHLIKLNKPFAAGEYTVTALRAAHGRASSPVVYIIEKDGKSIFYSNDTSEYPEESWAYLRTLEKPLDLISLDCTEACNNAEYEGHLTLDRCAALRDELIRAGAANAHTQFILNHFSHNGKHVSYDEFVPLAKERGFAVSYDGMEVEV